MMNTMPLKIGAALLAGVISAVLARRKGWNPWIWFAVGFFFGIFGIFALFFAGQPKKKRAPAAPKKRVFKIDGPTDKFWYYLDPSQQQQGPMSRDAIAAAWRDGKIGLSTFVWHEDIENWKKLKELGKFEFVDTP